jgi:DNA-binding PadR family transcriptional regulator
MKNIRSQLTTLDLTILGLVLQTPLSGYGIRMMFEKTALASYSSSPGSIYPALARMIRLGMLTKKKGSTGKQELFFITKKGKTTLTQWVTQPLTKMDVVRNMDILVLRFAFMDLLASKTEKRKFLQAFREILTTYIQELEDYLAANAPTMLPSGRQAFEHGLNGNKLTMQWITKLLSTNP